MTKQPVPKDVQRAVKQLLNWCGVFQGEAENRQLEFLDVAETPARIARMFRYELLASYQPGAFQDLVDRFTTFDVGATGSKEMIVETELPFQSVCAHHVLPFYGTAAVGYIPEKKIVGLSKIPRVIDFYSHKLQLQERLTTEIADFLQEYLAPRASIVVLKAEHLCMSCRGVKKPGAKTITSAIRGSAMNGDSVKQEFYRLIGRI